MEFFIGPGPSQMQRLGFRLASFTLLELPKKFGVKSIEFFMGPGPSQTQRLSLRLAFLTLLGPPEKNWEFRVLNFSLALGLPKRSV